MEQRQQIIASLKRDLLKLRTREKDELISPELTLERRSVLLAKGQSSFITGKDYQRRSQILDRP